MSKGCPLDSDAGAEEDRPAARAASVLEVWGSSTTMTTRAWSGRATTMSMWKERGGVWDQEPEMGSNEAAGGGGLAGHLLLTRPDVDAAAHDIVRTCFLCLVVLW